MPPFRRGFQKGLRPIVTIKHVIDTNGSVSAALQSVTDIYDTRDSPSSFTNQVETGARVRAFYLRVEVIGVVPAGGVDNIYFYVIKNPGNRFILPSADAIGASDLKSFIIHQEMIMTTPQATSGAGGDNGIPRTMFKGVILIPRLYQRLGVEDKLQLVLQHRGGEATQTTRFCVEVIYKEIR